MSKSYGKYKCNKCGKMVSLCGLGSWQHDQWHKRQAAKGEAVNSASHNKPKGEMSCHSFWHRECVNKGIHCHECSYFH